MPTLTRLESDFTLLPAGQLEDPSPIEDHYLSIEFVAAQFVHVPTIGEGPLRFVAWTIVEARNGFELFGMHDTDVDKPHRPDEALDPVRLAPRFVPSGPFSLEFEFGVITARAKPRLDRLHELAERFRFVTQVARERAEGIHALSRFRSNTDSMRLREGFRVAGSARLQIRTPPRAGLYALVPESVDARNLRWDPQQEDLRNVNGIVREKYLVARFVTERRRPDLARVPAVADVRSTIAAPSSERLHAVAAVLRPEWTCEDLTQSERDEFVASIRGETWKSKSRQLQAEGQVAITKWHRKKLAAPGLLNWRKGGQDSLRASAFAPEALQAKVPELVSVAIYREQDARRVSDRMDETSPELATAGATASMGSYDAKIRYDVVLSSPLAAILSAPSTQMARTEPLYFDFVVEAEQGRVPFIARILADGAQVGSIAFVREAFSRLSAVRSQRIEHEMLRPERVFISYSRNDSDRVALVVGAYERAGIPYFFDRASLRSGVVWEPALKAEIDRSDLFHLCWSNNAAGSKWVREEMNYAIDRRSRTGEEPDFTIQMMHKRPWPEPPSEWAHLNFADFLRDGISAVG